MGVFIAAMLLPSSLFMRRRPSAQVMARAEAVTRIARSDVGISPRLLLTLLVIAGFFSCCAAMSMPQVHIVAYCGDLGYGEARGVEMLSLMLFLGIVLRVGSGIVSDAIGGTAPTLLIGSFMQGLALLLYLYFDGLTSLFVVSGIFGLFQGGIVPMYAVICRELLPPREAAREDRLVVSATIVGMAFGGYFSGVIYDFTSSYKMAFLNGATGTRSILPSSVGSSGVGRGVCLRSRRSRLESAALFLFLRRRVAFTVRGGTCGLGRPNDTARDGPGGCARRCWARTTGSCRPQAWFWASRRRMAAAATS